MAKRVFRALGLIFGCVFAASLVSVVILHNALLLDSSWVFLLQCHLRPLVVSVCILVDYSVCYSFQGYTIALNLVELSWQQTPRIVYYYQV